MAAGMRRLSTLAFGSPLPVAAAAEEAAPAAVPCDDTQTDTAAGTGNESAVPRRRRRHKERPAYIGVHDGLRSEADVRNAKLRSAAAKVSTVVHSVVKTSGDAKRKSKKKSGKKGVVAVVAS